MHRICEGIVDTVMTLKNFFTKTTPNRLEKFCTVFRAVSLRFTTPSVMRSSHINRERLLLRSPWTLSRRDAIPSKWHRNQSSPVVTFEMAPQPEFTGRFIAYIPRASLDL
ncbi:hypothetical protein QE152_g9431 [Popillia japonica]|uniref:Uncharacterized protein n=1 Tax=Popillia japonica TaxID=7064 RepID=A0AAW1LYL2_POPJA